MKRLEKGVCFLIHSQVGTDEWLTFLPPLPQWPSLAQPTHLMAGFCHLSSVPSSDWRDQPELTWLASSQAGFLAILVPLDADPRLIPVNIPHPLTMYT